MKIVRLDLLAFGPFTATALVLEQTTAQFHLVYGPNEAGKSSSLRALKQWLYGIGSRTADAFVHPYAQLRVGGVLEKSTGERLEFRRRKGNRSTLLSADESEVLDDAVLADVLGGVDETAFSCQFGIDHAELRRGGDLVAQGSGDLGQLLWAAGAGAAEAHKILKALEEEAAALYKSSGSRPPINEHLRLLKEMRAAIAQQAVSTAEWAAADRGKREAEERLLGIEAQLAAGRANVHRLERQIKALPLLGQRKSLLAQRSALGDAVLLPEDFSSRREGTSANLAAQERSAAAAERAIELLELQIAENDPPAELLRHRTTIDQLHRESGSIAKAEADRPRLEGQLQGLEAQVKELLTELGRPWPTSGEPLEIGLSGAQRQRIQTLASDHSARLEQRHQTERVVRQRKEELARIEGALQAPSPERDVSELRRLLRRWRRAGDLDGERSAARSQLDRGERQAAVELRRLAPWTGTFEGLESLAVPDPETLERWDGELRERHGSVAALAQEVCELRERLDENQRRADSLRRQFEVPSEAELYEVRRQRDALWRSLRQRWDAADESGASRGAMAERVDGVAPRAEAEVFETLLGQADALADRLRRESDRVAELSRLTAECDAWRVQLAEREQACAAAQERLRCAEAEWAAVWEPVGIAPRTPAEMRGWLTRQRHLAEKAREIREQRERVAALESRLDKARRELSQAMPAAGGAATAASAALEDLLDQAESFAESAESEARSRQNLADRAIELRAHLAEDQRAADDAGRQLDQWQARWGEAIAELGLPAHLPPQEVHPILHSIDELARVLKEADDLRSRVRGIDRDARRFEDAVHGLLETAATDLISLSAVRAVADLNDRLREAEQAQSRCAAWRDQLQAERQVRDSARREIEQLRTALQTLCAQARCATAEELPEAESRSHEVRRLGAALASVDERLGELAGGSELNVWTEALAELDGDALQAEVTQQGELVQRLEQERAELLRMLGGIGEVLKQMDGGSRAAAAAEDEQARLAELRRDVERYARLRLAIAVLREAVDRFREENQDPILARASHWFQTLTLDAFRELRADFDGEGRRLLVGVRSTGTTVGTGEMSDGTRDQLYLALRLALVEKHLANREPLPFIVDDILVMFDDDRSRAALRALAELSRQTQVIFFTHHAHLVDLAQRHLDPKCVAVHRLDHRVAKSPNEARSRKKRRADPGGLSSVAASEPSEYRGG